jgi:hypothetical protein
VQHEAQLFALGFNAQREGLVHQQFLAGRHVFELHLRQQPVRNDQQILIHGAQLQ